MSRHEHQRGTALADQSLALTAYLDSLLREVQAVPAEPVQSPAPQPSRPETKQPAAVRRDTAAPTSPRAESAATATEELAPGPGWADEPFQCLLFAVHGLTLAVPLVRLSGIAEWSDSVTPLPGKPAWFLGVVVHRDRQVGIVDTARLVMPDRAAPVGAGHDYTHIVFCDDGRWGLGCQQVREVVTLAKEKVRWRGARTTRPWLAGTVIDHMCALLDIEALTALIGAEK